MRESEKDNTTTKGDKKEIGGNAHVIAIILLVAFIIIDIIIIFYIFYENDKYHTIYPEVSKKEAIEIKDYLIERGIEANLDKSGKVIVPKDYVETATLEVTKKFYPSEQVLDLTTNNDEITEKVPELDSQTLIVVDDLQITVANKLKNHVAINKAIVRIDDYNSNIYDVNVTVVITLEDGMDLLNADIDTISWLISSLVDDCELDNITLINSQTNAPFAGGVSDIS